LQSRNSHAGSEAQREPPSQPSAALLRASAPPREILLHLRTAGEIRTAKDNRGRRLTGSPGNRCGVNQRRVAALENVGFSRDFDRAGGQKSQNSVNQAQVVRRLDLTAKIWLIWHEKAVNQIGSPGASRGGAEARSRQATFCASAPLCEIRVAKNSHRGTETQSEPRSKPSAARAALLRAPVPPREISWRQDLRMPRRIQNDCGFGVLPFKRKDGKSAGAQGD
jgi:hypothetical protein